MKQYIYSANTNLSGEDQQELSEVYSKILALQDLLGVEEDRFFDNAAVRSALFRCYNHIESARKALAKYCESSYD